MWWIEREVNEKKKITNIFLEEIYNVQSCLRCNIRFYTINIIICYIYIYKVYNMLLDSDII